MIFRRSVVVDSNSSICSGLRILPSRGHHRRLTMVLDQIDRQFRSASHQITVIILDILHHRLRRMLHFHLSKDLRQTFVSVRRPPFHIQLRLLQLQRVKSVHRKSRSEEIHKTYNIENRQMAPRIMQNGQMIKQQAEAVISM